MGHVSLKGPSPAAPGLILDAYQGLCVLCQWDGDSLGRAQTRDNLLAGDLLGVSCVTSYRDIA